MTGKPTRQEQEEATTEITEVAPGVLRSQLPIRLPGLGHVNCYIIEDERGIAVVDPGLPGDDSWDALKVRLKLAGYKLDDVHTAVVTHSHFDHFGGAPRLREEVQADILTHDTFRIAVEADEANHNEDSGSLEALSEQEIETEIERRIEERFSKPLPWGTKRTPPTPERVKRMRQLGAFSNAWVRTPEPSITVEDSQMVSLGRRDWIALHTPGHTEDHLCLYDPENGVMLTGDHVLPSITPHIGGMTRQDDPLQAFFDSLQRMTTFDGVTVALPAHGHPFTDLAGRADHICEHHQERLQTIRDAAAEMPGGTVTDYMKVLFRERSWGDMAESETFAHLEHLKLAGEIVREDPDGVANYRPS